jgi:hypothetical protein
LNHFYDSQPHQQYKNEVEIEPVIPIVNYEKQNNQLRISPLPNIEEEGGLSVDDDQPEALENDQIEWTPPGFKETHTK